MKLPEAGDQLFEPESLTSGQHRYFRKALRPIESHPEEKLTIEEIANRAECSPTTLKNAFRTMLGTSVHAYSRRVKVETAMRLLKSSSMSIAEAARAVGFANAGKFSAAFRTETGQTPREWRKTRSEVLRSN